MTDQLFIGTRRYSSWSLRGWLAVRLAGLEVEEVVVPLAGGVTPALKGLTPTGLVPALRHDGRMIWDSLAICEYCAELVPALWPAARGDRAVARSVAAEMHAGFRDLRIAMPMNVGRQDYAIEASEAVLADIARIDAVWQECLETGGKFLFGDAMTVPDIMYAPVVARFLSFGPELSQAAAAYCTTVRSHPLLQEWYGLALAEPMEWRLAKYE